MKIKLRIEGKEKTFTNDFIPGRVLRRAIEITKEVNLSDINTGTLDQLVDFAVEAYGKQFTRDEFYDGVEAFGMLKKLMEVIHGIVDKAAQSVGADTNDPNSQQRA